MAFYEKNKNAFKQVLNERGKVLASNSPKEKIGKRLESPAFSPAGGAPVDGNLTSPRSSPPAFIPASGIPMKENGKRPDPSALLASMGNPIIRSGTKPHPQGFRPAAGTPIILQNPDSSGFRPAGGTPMSPYPPGFRIAGDQEAGGHAEWMDNFSEKKIRRSFIRKVYLILTAQLVFTFGVICLFIFEPNVKHFVLTNVVVLYVALGIYFVVLLLIVCVEKFRREFPLNMIMLTIFTMCLSYIMATLSCLKNTDAVLMAVGICAVVCFAVSLFSFSTKFDFTNCGGILCILLVVLIIFGLVAIFIRSHIMTMVYAGAGALLFMAYLAYDTQLIMGGKRYEISPEEYVLAAIMLYVDILYIFMYILMLFGGEGGS